MWLLTDVPVTGQRMSYLAGSHATKHQWRTHEDTRFTEARARAIGGRVVECAAPAGSVVLFDTNGVHRPNRNAGPVRDTLVGVYSAGRYREGCEVDASVFSRLSSWQLTVLERSRMRSGGPR
jgi:hypothetical protein